MELAPICLFVYNRPVHTQRTLEELSKNNLANESTIYIYADGPPIDASEELLANIRQTRVLLRDRAWCKSVVVIESAVNKGLANSIIQGVTEIVNKHGKVIVLEDDILPSKGFLKYMNDALNVYQDEEKVMHISGYMYPVTKKIENGTIFLRILSCWGWATWSRAWQYFSSDVEKYLSLLDSKHKIKRFNILGSAPFYSQLIDNYHGKIHTWAVMWYSSWYFEQGFSLFPKTTMVTNIGHDGTGIHSGISSKYQPNFVANEICVSKQRLVECHQYLRLIDTFYRTMYQHKAPFTLKKTILRFKKLVYRALQKLKIITYK